MEVAVVLRPSAEKNPLPHVSVASVCLATATSAVRKGWLELVVWIKRGKLGVQGGRCPECNYITTKVDVGATAAAQYIAVVTHRIGVLSRCQYISFKVAATSSA